VDDKIVNDTAGSECATPSETIINVPTLSTTSQALLEISLGLTEYISSSENASHYEFWGEVTA
jgi:hypothetical protein